MKSRDIRFLKTVNWFRYHLGTGKTAKELHRMKIPYFYGEGEEKWNNILKFCKKHSLDKQYSRFYL